MPQLTPAFNRRINYLVAVSSALTLIFAYVITRELGFQVFNPSELRKAFFESDFLASVGGPYFIWFKWFGRGALYGAIVMSAIHARIKLRVVTPQVIIVLLCVATWSLLSGGRTEIFYGAFLFAGVWMSGIRLSLRVRRIYIKFIGFSVVAFAVPLMLQTLNRGKAVETAPLGEMVLYKYFIGPSFAFDQLLQQGIIGDIQNSLGRVGLSFQGLDTFVVSGFLRGALGLDIPSVVGSTSFYFDYGVFIGESVKMNAHYTAGIGFFIDFGLIGMCAFYTVFSFILVYVDSRTKNRSAMSSGSMALYSILFTTVALSIREWTFNAPEFLVMCGVCAAICSTSRGRSSVNRFWDQSE